MLVTIRDTDYPSRLAWVNVDGSGNPEYITSTGEYSDRGRISPEGRRILCQITPKRPPGVRSVIRLFVIDLATGNRTTIDEPGQTNGHSWSPDGARVAYTWQPTLDHPKQMSVREILLITCNADGSDRKVVARREHTIPSSSSGRSGYPIFFRLLDWR
jgi:Tol biopolymer transport system component